MARQSNHAKATKRGEGKARRARNEAVTALVTTSSARKSQRRRRKRLAVIARK